MKVSDVRQLIVNALQDLGFGDPEPLGERLLTRDRFYVGCRFDFDGVSAIWLEEAGQVRLFDASGMLLRTVPVAAKNDGNAVEQAA